MPRLLVVATLVVALAGCKAGDALSTREVIVHFAPTATAAQHQEVQQVCGQVPNASPLPIPTDAKLQSLTDVHFFVKPGTDKNLQRLYNCLAQDQFRGVVVGYDAPDM